MKITSEQAKAIIFGDYLDEGFSVKSLGDWVSDGKYEYNETVFKYKNKYYSLGVSRTGSHFTDWHYDWEDTDTFDTIEVEEVEITTTKWVVVK